MNLLVLSATASAINYVNALAGRPGLNLFVSDASPYASGLYHHGVVPVLLPRARDLDNYRSGLDQVIAHHKIDVLVPTSDHDMEGVMELLQHGWTPPARLFRPSYDVYRLLTHKALLNKAMHEAGLPAPLTYETPADVEFPAVVKPAREGGSKGVWIVNNQHELADRLQTVERLYPGQVLIQQFIPGGTGSIYVALLLFDQAGRVRGEVASHSHLTYMSWGGGGVAGTVVDEPQLLVLARRIIDALGGWCGPVNLEFKRHAQTGQFYLLEVNCRLNGYSYLYTMNGLNFPAAVVDVLSGKDTPFLSLAPDQPRRRFVIGFRERPVENWCRAAS